MPLLGDPEGPVSLQREDGTPSVMKEQTQRRKSDNNDDDCNKDDEDDDDDDRPIEHVSVD